MKLFEKYLLACTNQRIPLPSGWQRTLGLSLEPTVQKDTQASSPITGYRFQQDEVLQRGFAHRQVSTMQLNAESTYLLQLYLLALKEHKGIKAYQYLSVGTTTYEYPYYTTKVDAIKEFDYTLYGRSGIDAKLILTNTARGVEIYRQYIGALDANSPVVLHTSKVIEDYLASSPKGTVPVESNKFTIDNILYEIDTSANCVRVVLDSEKSLNYMQHTTHSWRDIEIPIEEDRFTISGIEYTIVTTSSTMVALEYVITSELLAQSSEFYELIITSGAPVTVVPGAYPDTPLYTYTREETVSPSFTARVALSDKGIYYPLLLSRAGYFGLQFSNKLIPVLLGMNITDESPLKERELLPVSFIGEDFKQKIMLNTPGIFDVDENLGDKIVW